MVIDLQFIFGALLGIEFAEREELEESGIEWGFHIDLLILRLVVFKPQV
jgi:hypothetical protein